MFPSIEEEPPLKKPVSKVIVLSGSVVFACLAMGGTVLAQTGSTRAAAPAGSAAAQRALLDRYCVTCHNDKLKTANLSLQGLDLATAADHPEIWEQVIRKLRAGMMPPPGLPRPPLAQYEQLRDWLEAEIDRKAALHPNPGAVVLHRLNRTEYANAIRDLLDLQIDVSTLLPPNRPAEAVWRRRSANRAGRGSHLRTRCDSTGGAPRRRGSDAGPLCGR